MAMRLPAIAAVAAAVAAVGVVEAAADAAGDAMGAINPNLFIHAANILLLVAYCVRDVLWLRLFAVASALVAIPYFFLQPEPLWQALAWSALFAVINGFQSWRLFLERRPIQLTSEEELVRKLVFRDLPPRKVLQVIGVGSWSTSKAGDHLLTAGKLPDALPLVVSGKVQVTVGGRVLGLLGPGDIVGSAMLMSGAVSDLDAVAVEPVRTLRWEVGTLDTYLAAHPETRVVLQQHLARDLAEKLQRITGDSLAGSPSATDPQAPKPPRYSA
jgi:hypothetical protein